MMMMMMMMMTMLMRLPLMVKILSIEMSMKEGLNEGCCEILKYSQVYEPYRSIVGQERG